MTEELYLLVRLGVALGVGFLIGLQREYAYGGEGRSITAGERTFALIGMSGFLAAMLSDQVGSEWILVIVIFLVGFLVTSVHFVNAWHRERAGVTTEVAIIIAVLVGALSYYDFLQVAVAVGITTTIVLSLKLETDRFVEALTREDISAALQLAVISAIVLPVLPSKELLPAPYNVLVPFKIWLMVVFISSISFLGYVLIKVIGTKRGIGLTGFLGGLVSSTALTMSFSARSKKLDKISRRIALAIILSWTVMFLRVIVEIGVLNYELLQKVWMPISASGIAALIYCVYLYFSQKDNDFLDLEFANPFDLGSAIRFGLLYGFILLVSSAAGFYWQDTGVMVSSIISGTVSMNAVALSLAELSKTGAISVSLGGQAAVYATMASTLAKGSMVLMGGSPALKKAVLPGLVLILLTGIGAVALI